MNEPKLSIVTVCYNAEKTIEATLQSIKSQMFRDFEQIVIDGGSRDSTMDIIRRYADGLAHVISESDDGIGDAMNKGWRLCSGEYVLFLHADDYLVDDSALARVVPHLDGTADIVGFDILFETEAGRFRHKQRVASWAMRLRCLSWHQGVWFRRDLLERLGPYDVGLRIAMDYEFFLRAAKAGMRFRTVDDVFSVMRDTGVSSRVDWASLRHRFAEERTVHLRLADAGGERLLYHLFWSAYLPYRYLRFRFGH